MTPKETSISRPILEWLDMLQEPARSLALSNIDDDAKICTSHKMADALIDAFNWTDSPEGFAFWLEIHKQEDHKGLPCTTCLGLHGARIFGMSYCATCADVGFHS